MNFRKERVIVLFAALAVAGCSGPTASIVLRRLHLTSQRVYYVQAEQFKTVEFAPPPAPDSDAQKADLAAVLDWQARRTAADCARANVTAVADYEYFLGAKSPFPSPLPAEVKKTFDRLGADLDGAVTNMKERYRRSRVYKTYPGRAEPCVKKSWGYSYPSGHTIFSRVFANVLTDIIPARRDEFFATADGIASDRLIGGVHYPTDLAAGKVFADRFHAELLKSEAYLKDIEKLKACLVR
ncbi:MAG TPA: phosphatase PAP2 family protein [Elusimicrobiales bacterium]|nr:phosphatase PAP2 family protein [Elusimicrobiales bacterium]